MCVYIHKQNVIRKPVVQYQQSERDKHTEHRSKLTRQRLEPYCAIKSFVTHEAPALLTYGWQVVEVAPALRAARNVLSLT